MSCVYFVCPKCAWLTCGVPNTTEKCIHCQTIMLQTQYDYVTTSVSDDEKIREEYVYNNEMYDPKAKEQAELNFQKMMNRIDANIAKEQAIMANQPKCPTCSSTNVSKISTLNRAVSVGVFGLLSGKIGKSYECKNCGYKW